MTTVRSFFSMFVFVAVLLCTLFLAAQMGWSSDILCGSTPDAGSGEACEFSDAVEATDSEDDSPQVAVEDCVASRVSVSDCASSRLYALMKDAPPSTILISQLLHPPTAY